MSLHEIIHEATSALGAEAARTNTRFKSRNLYMYQHPNIPTPGVHERPQMQTYQMLNAQLII